MKRLYACLLVWLLACVHELEEPPTQITLRIVASVAVEQQTERLVVRISPRVDDDWVENEQALVVVPPELKFPADIPVVPGPGKPRDGEFEVIVEAWGSAQGEPELLADARVLTNFVPREQKLLSLELVFCAGSDAGVCELDRMCHGEDCASCGANHECRPTTLSKPGEGLVDLDRRGAAARPPVEVAPPDAASDAATFDAGAPLEPEDAGDADASRRPLDGGRRGADAGHDMDASTWVPIEVLPDPASCKPTGQDAHFPFGHHVTPYTNGARLPSHMFRSERDEIAERVYDRWKARYVVDGECGEGLVHVDAPASISVRTTSESHGLAMLITALMAGHDPDAHRLFDGLLNYYLAHPSSEHPFLMARAQDKQASCETMYAGSSSEGDLDIAYALLLADKQWGSTRQPDYRGLARAMLAGIQRHDVEPQNRYMYLGSQAYEEEDHRDATRTSDVMPGHFAAFEDMIRDGSWAELAERELAIVKKVQTPSTGLLPSFVVSLSTDSPRAADGDVFGVQRAGDFSEQASRAPLRIALDYLIRGRAESESAVATMNTWMDTTTQGDPLKVKAGYRLDGTAYSEHTSMAFVAPLGVSAMVSARQDWLNALWDVLSDVELDDGSYLGDTLELLSLIAMSGNWWSPEQVDCPEEIPPPDGGVDAGDGGIKPTPQCYGDMPPLNAPPCEIPLDAAPMYVSLGFSDEGSVEAVRWALELAERYSARFTFFVACEAAADPKVLEVWTEAARAGHELAPQLTAAQLAAARSEDALRGDIEACARLLNEQILGPEGQLDARGFRAAGLRYTDALLGAVQGANLSYDSSIVEGDQREQDGTDFFWPYALREDPPSPGHAARLADDPSLGPLTPRFSFWEIPVYALVPPPPLRRTLATRGAADPRKVVADDVKLWGDSALSGLSMTKDEALATLSYAYERRVKGNRAPLVLSLHTKAYEASFDVRARGADSHDRRQAIDAFLAHILGAPQRADLVTHRYIYGWMMNPHHFREANW